MHRIARVVASSLLIALTLSCGENSPLKGEAPAEVKAALAVLRDSQDAAQLEAAALSLCKAEPPEALSHLLPILRDKSFLQRLDSEEDYVYYEHRLRIRRILDAMGKCASSQAAEALWELSRDKGFVENLARLNALVDACGLLERPSPNLLVFLDSQAQSGSGVTNRVIRALARIGSAEACQLIEKKLSSKDYTQLRKKSWFTYYLIESRNNPGVVDLYARLLRNNVPDPDLRKLVVLTLFDYRPREWYSPSRTYPMPPARMEASTGVLTGVLKCADLALKLDVPQEVKDQVKLEQMEIRSILAARKACCGNGVPGNEGAGNMEAAVSILKNCQEPAQLEVAAVSLCKAEAPEAVSSLVPILRDTKFLQRLDPQEDYGYGGHRLRLWRILDAMGKSHSSQAVQALEELTEDKDFVEKLGRRLALINACIVLGKSSPKLLAFLDSQARPGNSVTDLVVKALATISSMEACQLIEEKLSSKDYKQSIKEGWLTGDLLEARNKLGVVGLYKKLLKNHALDPELRRLVVLTLFDYRPREWYAPVGNWPEPPPRMVASTEVLTEVLECADLALKLDVPQEVKERVRVARKEIEDILAARKAKKEHAPSLPKSD